MLVQAHANRKSDFKSPTVASSTIGWTPAGGQRNQVPEESDLLFSLTADSFVQSSPTSSRLKADFFYRLSGNSYCFHGDFRHID